MKITLHQDVKKFVLTSTLKKADIELVKKYAPDALKIKDKDGNDVFGMSYCADKHGVSKVGVTFGGVNKDGFAIVVGDLPANLPENQKPGEYVADIVGAAIQNINVLEEAIPAVVTDIKTQRAELIGSITEA